MVSRPVPRCRPDQPHDGRQPGDRPPAMAWAGIHSSKRVGWLGLHVHDWAEAWGVDAGPWRLGPRVWQRARSGSPRPRTPSAPMFRWLAPGAVEAEAALQRFRPTPGALQAEAVSCTGSAYCRLCPDPTKGTAQRWLEELEATGLTCLESVVPWTGCPNASWPAYMGSVAMMGRQCPQRTARWLEAVKESSWAVADGRRPRIGRAATTKGCP